MDDLVVNGAELKCTMGNTPCYLSVPSGSKLGNGDVANQYDTTLDGNFGICSVKQYPPPPLCTPDLMKPWLFAESKTKSRGNEPAISTGSITFCPTWGGVVTITKSGQAEGDGKRVSTGANMDVYNVLGADKLLKILEKCFGEKAKNTSLDKLLMSINLLESNDTTSSSQYLIYLFNHAFGSLISHKNTNSNEKHSILPTGELNSYWITDNPLSASGLTEKELYTALSKLSHNNNDRNSNWLAEYSYLFLEIEETHSINALFLAGLAGSEGGWDESANKIKNFNNLYGIKGTGDAGKSIDGFKKYSSREESIRDAANLLINNYLTPNGKYYESFSDDNFDFNNFVRIYVSPTPDGFEKAKKHKIDCIDSIIKRLP